MKKISILLLLSAFNLDLQCQNLNNNDTTLSANTVRLSAIYTGIAGEVVNGGGGFGFSSTFIINEHYGGSISYREAFLSARNLPDDENFIFNPVENIKITSFMFILELPAKNGWPGAGFEIGPSLIAYTEVEFTPNPEYYEPCFFICLRKYLKEYIKKDPALGLSMRVKVKFVNTRYFGMEIAPFTNLNTYRSLIGFELFLNFGRVNSKKSSLLSGS